MPGANLTNMQGEFTCTLCQYRLVYLYCWVSNKCLLGLLNTPVQKKYVKVCMTGNVITTVLILDINQSMMRTREVKQVILVERNNSIQDRLRC